MVEFPFKTPALRVTQPIGTFYVAVLPADLLLQVASSDVMSATLNENGVGYSLTGTQRLIQDKRLGQIADYIDRSDAAFPNAIILAANYDNQVGFDQDEVEAITQEEAEEQAKAKANDKAQPQGKSQADDQPQAGKEPAEPEVSHEWVINEGERGALQLEIPTPRKLAAIIDGQHRLFAFAKADARTRLGMELLCAIFIDLPKPFQAQLFATINSTQKPVDRSLTFELFGYNVSDEPEVFWAPDKLAVFLSRKLGTEAGSLRIPTKSPRDSDLMAPIIPR